MKCHAVCHANALPRGLPRGNGGFPPKCNAVQRVPENGTVIDIERPSRKKADPVLPRSAANGFDSGAALNLRVVGSIRYLPAFCFAQRFFCALEIAARAFADIVRFFLPDPLGRPGPRLFFEPAGRPGARF